MRGQDGWILAKFFFACLWTKMKSRSINSQKKNEANIQPIKDLLYWSIKDLLYGFWGSFACGIQRVVPSGQDCSILPARGASHIINKLIVGLYGRILTLVVCTDLTMFSLHSQPWSRFYLIIQTSCLVNKS